MESADLAVMAAQDANPWRHAPFDAASAERLRPILTGLDAAQRMWLSGYLAGSVAPALPARTEAATRSRPVATILYGSQSGNCERIARLLGEKLSQRHIGFTLLDMMDCRKARLQETRNLIVIVSTHGDGDPPERALPFQEWLHAPRAPRLEQLAYCVLALGDRSYEKFCETGRQFDARLEALGARRIQPREDCDVDFETQAHRWMDAVLATIAAQSGVEAVAVTPDTEARTASIAIAHTRKNPFHAEVLANQRLTARHSTKDVRHIELSLEGSHIRYEPGDAIGIVPRNREEDVDEVLEAARFSAESAVSMDSQALPLRQALIEHLEIGPVTGSFLQRYAQATGNDALPALCASPENVQQYVRGRHLADLVREHAPAGLTPQSFVQLLRPLAPRLYSIASSQRANPEDVHLTVSVVEYESLQARRRGVVSGFLAALGANGDPAPIYLHRNAGFRLPQDPRTAVIMIGPGTGVAPFRGFLAEREAIGAGGRNWLFFGDRTLESDFLYQSEWLEWRKSGLLTRLDVAFSRDQVEKLYVQHRLREHGAALWGWLQEGAHVYVCGDAEHMAPDVNSALLEVARRHGGLSEEQAAEYLTGLQRDRRYQKDVY